MYVIQNENRYSTPRVRDAEIPNCRARFDEPADLWQVYGPRVLIAPLSDEKRKTTAVADPKKKNPPLDFPPTMHPGLYARSFYLKLRFCSVTDNNTWLTGRGIRRPRLRRRVSTVFGRFIYRSAAIIEAAATHARVPYDRKTMGAPQMYRTAVIVDRLNAPAQHNVFHARPRDMRNALFIPCVVRTRTSPGFFFPGTGHSPETCYSRSRPE